MTAHTPKGLSSMSELAVPRAGARVWVRPLRCVCQTRPRSRISSTTPSRSRRLRRAFASAQVADRPSADEGP
jgi:hypothetical protein